VLGPAIASFDLAVGLSEFGESRKSSVEVVLHLVTAKEPADLRSAQSFLVALKKRTPNLIRYGVTKIVTEDVGS